MIVWVYFHSNYTFSVLAGPLESLAVSLVRWCWLQQIPREVLRGNLSLISRLPHCFPGFSADLENSGVWGWWVYSSPAHLYFGTGGDALFLVLLSICFEHCYLNWPVFSWQNFWRRVKPYVNATQLKPPRQTSSWIIHFCEASERSILLLIFLHFLLICKGF